jgi:hypothetical protein
MEGIFMSGKLKQYELEIRNIRKKIKLIKLGKRHALWILKNSKNEPLKLVIHCFLHDAFGINPPKKASAICYELVEGRHVSNLNDSLTKAEKMRYKKIPFDLSKYIMTYTKYDCCDDGHFYRIS